MPDTSTPDNLDELGIFRIPSSATWNTISAALLARLDALEADHVIDLGFSIGDKEVAWVSIHHHSTGTITARAPHGPYETANSTAWNWNAADQHEQPARSSLIASTITDYLSTRDGVPADTEPVNFNAAAQFRVSTPTSGFRSRQPEWERYDEHRTGAQLNNLLHFGHSIPMGKGLTRDHINENFPGWTWDSLIAVLKAADVFVGRGGAPPRCRPTVKAIHFTDARTWAVEWLSGETTRSLGRDR